jgi:hypothetical protein
LDELLDQLKDKKSAKRRSASKKLRKLGNVEAGPFILEALQNELKDARAWETQYQMIMAIGECEYKKALPFIKEISEKDFEATMVYMAIGDAIVRLSKINDSDAKPVIELFASGNTMLIDGGLRAMAMVRMVPSDSQISEIIKFVSTYSVDDGMRFWVIAASPGWSGAEVDDYLAECGKSARSEFRKAVDLAINKKYKKWQPL